MGLKDDFLSRGYLPEGAPPFFSTFDTATYFKKAGLTEYITTKSKRFRAAPYSASKRGLTRRVFSVVHPVTAHDVGRFIHTNRKLFEAEFAKSAYSMSVPKPTPVGDRAVSISNHGEFEDKRMERLAHYRFIARTDISRFYHAIYTHSIPWAAHGKVASKADFNPDSPTVIFNKLDQLVRNGQDAQTIGLPVGPDTSRYVAELISAAIDVEFKKRCDVKKYDVIRHVDDVYIGANTHADAERALWRYREALREYELDINESKTRIYSADFKFADVWPSEMSAQLKFALESTPHRKKERLRAALENIFASTVTSGDDGILKYAIRALDNSGLSSSDWEMVEPFLKRCAVHFGHTIDFVTRMVVWQRLVSFDFDPEAWAPIFLETLDRHGRLGNDSEVCWSLYACYVLQLEVPLEIAQHIAGNCNAMSLLALLSCVEKKLVNKAVRTTVFDRISLEDARGQFWPVMMEWVSKKWPKHADVKKLFDDETLLA